MVFKYLSGEEVKAGDRIKYDGGPGEVEFLATELTGNPEMDWFVEEHSPGFMITAKGFGSVYLSEADEDLVFVSRKIG